MLHVLFGYIPKPKNRLTVIESIPEIDSLVDKTYIKYETMSQDYPDAFKETFMTAKGQYNSHADYSSKLNGKIYKVFFSWEYFRRIYIGNEDEFEKIMKFLTKVFGYDVTEKYTMTDFINMFRKECLNREDVREFISEHYEKRGINDNPYFRTLFNIGNGENSGNVYNSKNPILNTYGVGCNISYDGELIVTFDDSELVKRLENYGCLPTLLDGGLVRVISLEKYPPYLNFENEFVIFPEWKSLYMNDNETVD